jgi:hypothetical protein
MKEPQNAFSNTNQMQNKVREGNFRGDSLSSSIIV